MGIKNLNELIKDFAPEAMFNAPVTTFANKRIAIDASFYMYSIATTAKKRVVEKTDFALKDLDIAEFRKLWISITVDFICGWLAAQITPVFVFDGMSKPIEKAETQAGRREVREKHENRIRELSEKLKSGDPLLVPVTLVEEIRKEHMAFISITGDDFTFYKQTIQGMGVPCIFATGDGEQLCTALCIEGKVAAVYSTDTDNLTHGCPLLITGRAAGYSFDAQGNRISMLTCVRLDKVLQGLKMSHDTFVDLCIMCGCDFNTNIPGIAARKSYTLLNTVGSIDNITNKDISCLNHLRCRQIFEYHHSSELIMKNDPNDRYPHYSLDERLVINKAAFATIRDFMHNAGVSDKLEMLYNNYACLQTATDGYSMGITGGYRYRAPMILTINTGPNFTFVSNSQNLQSPPITPLVSPNLNFSFTPVAENMVFKF